MDPQIVTVQSFTCSQCNQIFRRRNQLKSHVCPLTNRVPRFGLSGSGFWPPSNFWSGEPQHHWYLFTDGSGGTRGISGWGVGIFTTQNPNAGDRWAAALYGPVLTEAWDPLWLGADRHSNNTAELSAIGEACRWLLEQCSAAENTNEWEGMILYDSQYAYGVTRLFNPDT